MLIKGFSKMNREERLKLVSSFFSDPEKSASEFASYRYGEIGSQQRFEQFSENSISNFHLPYGVVPNFLLNGKIYMVPMAIEESSVVAAAARNASFWASRGGITSEVIATTKSGQVHFLYHGEREELNRLFEELRARLLKAVAPLVQRMELRGGGITALHLRDMSKELRNYYQLWADFETCDAMGANFINTVLEKLAYEFKKELGEKVEILMSILTNYTAASLVRVKMECPIDELADKDIVDPDRFCQRFDLAVRIAKIDPYRAVTHNKGIFNGIDAVVMATGNDIRAIEAAGHAYAARSGSYQGLTDLAINNGRFSYSLQIPLALGTVGGLTSLHPLAKKSLEMLGNPNAKDLMGIVAGMGILQNFAALRALITTGIQAGHMRMHLSNMMASLEMTEEEILKMKDYFKDHQISFHSAREYLADLRGGPVL